MSEALLASLDGRLAGLRSDRESWLSHWQQLALFILPRRIQWFQGQTARTNRGSPINAQILDSTGTIAARNLAAGMMSGITSPSRPWFKLRLEGQDVESSNPVSLWLAEVEKRMMRVFSESNFYNSIATIYFDLVVFGTAVMLIYEDYEDVIRCYVPCAGEYFISNSDRLAVDTIYREFTQTTTQLVQWFGEDAVSNDVKLAYDRGKADLQREFVVAHAVEPNTKIDGGPSSTFKYREVYWQPGNARDLEGKPKFLKVSGFHEWPAIAPRWDLASNDAYGRSPGMDALPDIKQLQHETKRKAQAIDKMVNPPLTADIQLKNQPASTLPGAVTYVAGQMSSGRPGFAPVYQVNPYIADMQRDIAEVQFRIKGTFHNDLFLMFQQLEGQPEPRSATIVDARREEKLVMLGPVLERFLNEGLDPAITRVFNIMLRGRLLPPPPAAISNKEIDVEYVSNLALAQSGGATLAIERMLQFGGAIAAAQTTAGMIPDVMDKLNFDAMVDEYGSKLNVPPIVINDDRSVAAARAKRAQDMAPQKAAQDLTPIVEGAKTLSDTPVGGGLSALQAIAGGAP